MSAHRLTMEQVAAVSAEHAPQIALSIVVANEHAAKTPFVAIVEAVEHDLRDALENLRIPEGGEA